MTPELSILIKATVALAVGLIAVQLGSRARAAVRHLVLASTLGILFVLPLVATFAPAVTLAVPVPAALARPATDAAALQGLTADNGNVADVRTASGRATSAVDAGPGALPSLATVLRAAWALGAVVLLGVLTQAIWRLTRVRRSAIPWLAGQAVADRLVGPDVVVRHVSVVVHEDVPGPVTCGWRRPMIVFPVDAQRWSGDDVERALVHELEHVRRGDWVLQLLARGICVAYSFQPLVWIAWRRLCLECERACDDAVVDRTADTEYAQQLVALAGRLAQSDLQPVLSMARRSDLALRVKAVLDRTQLRGRAGTSAVAAALVVTAVFALILAPMRVEAVPGSTTAAETSADVARPDVGTAAISATEGAEAVAEEGQRTNQRENRRDSDSSDRGSRSTQLGRALVETAQEGSLEDVVDLLDAGADVNSVVRGDGTALLVAARRGDRQMVDFLLQRGAVDIGVSGDGTALIQAARQGYLDIVRTLLDSGADVNLGVRGDGSPLIMAAGSGRLNMVSLLLERGADVNLAVESDGSPLIAAARGGHLSIVRLLLDRGANIHQVVPGDENAIISAGEGGRLDVIQFLMSRGADVNSRVWVENSWPEGRGEWRTALSQARRGGHTDVVRYLLSIGATD